MDASPASIVLMQSGCRGWILILHCFTVQLRLLMVNETICLHAKIDLQVGE